VVKGDNSDSSKWKGMEFGVKEAMNKWLQQIYIGKGHDFIAIEGVKDNFIFNGLEFIRLIYVGDNAFLLTTKGEQSIENAFNEDHQWLEKTFEYIMSWNNHSIITNRRLWVRCWGIPFNYGDGNALREL